jgi:hypothetical protein
MKIAAFCLCLILILTAPGVMAQQPPALPQSWDAVQQLQTGQKLRVEKKKRGFFRNRSYEGKLVSVSDTELVINAPLKTSRISRDEVKRVWYYQQPTRGNRIGNSLEGAGWGAGILFLFTFPALLDPDSDAASGEVASIFAGAAAAGALIGYFAAKGKKILVYSAP